jgi:2-dehydropantoate 2-reductase
VLGAGSVGLTAGARLGAAGLRVHFLVRGEAAARRLAAGGVEAEDPETGERARARATASARRPGDGPVLVCVRSPDTDAALAALASVGPGALVASVQNGVENDARVARRFELAAGVVWRLTCTRVAPNRALFAGRGRVVVGANPDSPAPRRDVRALAEAFRAAGFDASVTRDLAAERWLKLCVNLLSAPNALVRQSEHATRDFVAVKLALLEEARAVLAAAGIAARSGDGRDPSLDAMIDAQRAALERPPPPRRAPVYNDVWTALREGRALEALDHHRAITARGSALGVATPANERVLAALERARAAGLGPECLGAAELLVPRAALR